MRFILLILFLLQSVCIGQFLPVIAHRNAEAASSTLLDGLVTYWKLDETNGDRADSADTNTLYEASGTVSYAAGIQGNAAVFTGSTSDYLYAPDSPELGWDSADDSGTWSLWVYLDTSPIDYTALMGRSGGSWAPPHYDFSYVMKLRPTIPRVQYAGGNQAANAQWWNSYTFTPSTETWYHIVYIVDADNDEVSIIVNDGTPNTVSWSSGTQVNSGQFRMGAIDNQGLKGRIDEVCFWKRILTSSEITELYNSGSGVTYPFD